jgi:hypothetical protein
VHSAALAGIKVKVPLFVPYPGEASESGGGYRQPALFYEGDRGALWARHKEPECFGAVFC